MARIHPLDAKTPVKLPQLGSLGQAARHLLFTLFLFTAVSHLAVPNDHPFVAPSILVRALQPFLLAKDASTVFLPHLVDTSFARTLPQDPKSLPEAVSSRGSLPLAKPTTTLAPEAATTQAALPTWLLAAPNETTAARTSYAPSTATARIRLQSPKDFSDYMFVSWFALGDRGDEGHSGFQFLSPDMSFARVLAKSHPGARLVILTDQSTQFDVQGEPVEVVRHAIDKSKLGRNAYANYYQYQAMRAYLQALLDPGQDYNIVFMDMDILVVGSLDSLFKQEQFDYAVTISDATDMPINMGMQFIQKGHYAKAIEFLDDVLAVYRLEPVEEFTAGQIAIAEHLGIMHNPPALMALLDNATDTGYSCTRVHSKYQICFASCIQYNYCHHEQSCCTDLKRGVLKPVQSPADFEAAQVKALHFVGWRKNSLAPVYQSFIRGDVKGAFAAFAEHYKLYRPEAV